MPCFLKILCALCQGAGAALLDRIRVLQAATPMSLKTLLFMDSKLFLLATARCRVQQLTLRRAKGAWILCEVCVKYKATELKVDFSWHLNVQGMHAASTWVQALSLWLWAGTKNAAVLGGPSPVEPISVITVARSHIVRFTAKCWTGDWWCSVPLCSIQESFRRGILLHHL